MRFIDETLPNAKSYATVHRARATLEAAAEMIPSEATVGVYINAAGRFVAFIVYRDNMTLNIPAICARGIVITN